MRCLATDDTAENDDGIVTSVQNHLTGTVDQLKTTWERSLHGYSLPARRSLLKYPQRL
jgi:hypothetical protein